MSKSETWKMARAEITPERMRHAKKKLSMAGYRILRESDLELQIQGRTGVIRFYPFTGAFKGPGVHNDCGRGIQALLLFLRGSK